MRRIAVVAAFFFLMLILAGCKGQASQPAAPAAPAVPEPAQQTAAAQPQTPEPEATWHYELTKQTTKDEFIGEDDVKLASIDYEYPELTAVCEGDKDKCAEMPADVKATLDAFNNGVRDYILSLETAAGLAEMAKEQYNETDSEYRKYFAAYYATMEVVNARIAGDLAEAQLFGSVYYGGAHGVENVKNFHFDLKTGEFFELSDLTDTPEKLHDMIAGDIVDGIYDGGGEGEYFDGFDATIRSREQYNVALNEDGVEVIFDEYEIAPYASGLPTFTVPYEKIWRFLNERGRRLFDLPLETRVLGDYYDATEMWYWFQGCRGFDCDTEDVRTADYTTAYGDVTVPYFRVTEQGLDTMEKLKARLSERFSAEVVETLLPADGAMFREFDGRLYTMGAGRGADITVLSVDYKVELNAAKDGGRILADIHRGDYDETAEEWVATGEVDQVEFPFVLTDGGTVFSEFPTIW